MYKVNNKPTLNVNHFCFLHYKTTHIHVNVYLTSKGYNLTDVIDYPTYKRCISPSYPFEKTSEIESLVELKIGHTLQS